MLDAMPLWWSDPFAWIAVALLLLSLSLLAALAVRWLAPGRLPAVVLPLVLLLWIAAASASAWYGRRILRSNGVELHQPTPPLAFPSASGAAVPNLRGPDFRGQVVLLDLWATWCAPCRASEPALHALASRHAAEGLTLVRVDVDRDDSLWRQSLRPQPANVHDVRDASGDIAASLKVRAIPAFVLIDRSGVIRYRQAGWNPTSALVLRYRIHKLLQEPAP